MTALGVTPSQTIGPFFERALLIEGMNVVPGEPRVRLEGQMLDGDGQPVSDAMLEVWDAARQSFGRTGTDDEGRYWFELPRADHLVVTIFARGLLNHLSTRVYFAHDEADPILRLVPPARRKTLVAESAGADAYRWDVVLQGPAERETVFFAYRR